jgi:phosphonate transport system substrate-binding protein
MALAAIGLVASAGMVACGDDDGGGDGGTLTIGGIPDQDVSTLERSFGLMAEYLSRETGLDVEYVPSNDYAAIVAGFQRGDVQLAWFGGLTGVQARELVDGAEAIAQRPRDAEFHSVFIVGTDVEAESLADLTGLTFTFGSESSTSGHLMPRFHLNEAGIDPDTDFDGEPGYSGSHDATYRLVESGAFQAGALNEAVWDAAVAAGEVDTGTVRVLERTPAYYDYNWSLHPSVSDEDRAAIEEALFALNASMGDDEAELLDLFQTDSFVATSNDNYAAIRDTAVRLGIIE